MKKLIIKTSIPWVVRLSWFQNAFSHYSHQLFSAGDFDLK